MTFEIASHGTYPNLLAAYTGTSYGSLTQIARTEWNYRESMRFDAVAGGTYLIVADGGPFGGGQIAVRWSQYTDPVKPQGTVVIDGGASSTGQRMVTLTLSATDNIAVAGIRVSNSPMVDAWGDLSGKRSTQWVLSRAEDIEGNAATIRWSLTDLYRGGNNAGGTKTVYVQWRDEQGNWSPIASDTIVANLPPIGDDLPPVGSDISRKPPGLSLPGTTVRKPWPIL